MLLNRTTNNLKQRVDLLRYVSQDLGQPKNAGNGRVSFKCPFHKQGGERTGSFMVYYTKTEPDWYCYGCGCGGDIFTYVQMRTGMTFEDAVTFLNDEEGLPTLIRSTTPVEKEPPKVLTMAEVERYHYDMGRVVPYLESRKIAPTVAEKNLLGGAEHRWTYIDMTGRRWRFQCNRVVIPYLWGGEVVSQNFRRDDLSAMQNMVEVGKRHQMHDLYRWIQADLAEKWDCHPDDVSREQVLHYCYGTRFFKPKGTHAAAYGADYLMQRVGNTIVYPRRLYTILTEGEINRLSCESIGYPAQAVKAGAGVDIKNMVKNTRMVYVAVDPDEGGLLHATKIAEALGNNTSRVRFLKMTEDMNDMHKRDALGEFLSGPPYYLEPVH